MGIEIERKFLVIGTAWKENGTAIRCCQGYLCPGSGVTVRVRTMDGEGFLTVKGRGRGLVRQEFEYAIPLADARELLETMCGKPLIIKDRYRVAHAGLVWEVDEFAGENRGLVLAEVELSQPDQAVSLPPWVGREVSGDARYYNASLVSNPYTRWQEGGGDGNGCAERR
ncbi:MAG TPA: adenylate cyclase [Desulfobulbaceae bacterium]|nr:adenylate cyclase [Desulfobulbaceae bacterium]